MKARPRKYKEFYEWECYCNDKPEPYKLPAYIWDQLNDYYDIDSDMCGGHQVKIYPTISGARLALADAISNHMCELDDFMNDQKEGLSYKPNREVKSG